MMCTGLGDIQFKVKACLPSSFIIAEPQSGNGALPGELKKGDFSEMAEEPYYTYWTTECKTPSCGGLLLAYIGPFSERRVLFTPQCRPFEVMCPECKSSYTYAGNEVTSKSLALEPKGFIPCKSFLEAVRPEAHLELVDRE
jgi:hypothetical protein